MVVSLFVCSNETEYGVFVTKYGVLPIRNVFSSDQECIAVLHTLVDASFAGAGGCGAAADASPPAPSSP